MAQVTELVTKFAFAGSTAPLFNYNRGLSTAIVGLSAFSAAAIGTTGIVAKWSSSIIKSLDPLAQLERRTGVAIGRIQEIGFVASQTGSSVEAAQSTILSLTSSIADAALNGSEDFARLGISVRDASGQLKTADAVLSEVQDRFRNLSLTIGEQENLASALGIDATMVKMLNLSSKEMAGLTARARELGVLTSEQGAQVIAYNDALTEQRFAISAVKNLIAVGMAPAMTDLTKDFTNLIAKNKEWIIDGAEKTIDIGINLIEFFGNLGGAVLDLADYLTLGHGKMALLIGALAAGAAAFPVTAAIIAVALAVEDLITAFNGGSSVIADFFEDNFGVDIVQKTKDATDALMAFHEAAKIVTGGDIGGVRAEIPQELKDQFDFVPGPSGLQMVTRGGGPVQVSQDVNININTNNPAAAGRSVVENLNNQQENAINQLNTGGR